METRRTANLAEKVKVELKSTATAYCTILEDFDRTNSAHLASPQKVTLKEDDARKYVHSVISGDS